MSLVLAIDIGIKNLGLCAYDFCESKVVHWDNVSIVQGRYVPMQNVQYVRDFVARHAELFARAAVIVVERQMRSNMRVIEAVLQTMFFERCVVVSPRCVKMHYGIGHRDYRKNKVAAINWATEFCAANGPIFPPEVLDVFTRGKKQDDLADALLMVMYYLDTYSNQSLKL